MPPASTSAQALQNLQSYQSSAQSPEALLQGQEQQLGTTAAGQQVQGLQGAIQNTTNLLGQVAPSVMGRTQNSLVTSAQANQQINNQSAPLNTSLTNENNQYNQANSNYQDLLNEASTNANAQYTGEQNQESALQGIYNDLYTQESTAAQQAEAEREFNAQLASSNASSAAADASPTFGTSAASTQQPTQALSSDLVNAFNGFGTRQPGYTEQVIIPQLEQAYPEFDSSQITQAVYAYRKSKYGS